MTDNLLQAILSKLDRGDAPSNHWPDGKGEYYALCPFHNDTHASNFSVSERGYKCFVCGAQGGLNALAEKMGVAVARLHEIPGDTPHSIFLEDYARAKGLPIPFLVDCGVTDRKWDGRTVLRIAYLSEHGQEVATRYRLALTGDNRFRWSKGSRVIPYGLDRLVEARKAGYIIVVEGESDTQTLRFYHIPVLGIPGAATWQREWASYLEGLTVYLWRESDQGGQIFAKKVGESLPDALIMTPPPGRKDVSECHVLGDDVPAVLGAMKAAAKPYSAERATAEADEAAAALALALPILSDPDILGRVVATCEAQGLVGEGKVARLLYLALTSRHQEKPVSVALKGLSSAGKSFVLGNVLRMFPASAYLDFTSMSEHALVYDERPISHRFIVLYEAAGLGDDRPGEPNILAYCLRSLLSEGCIRYTTIEKTEAGMRPRVIERPGPTGLITTTTLARLHPENETRLLSVGVRDDRAQTAAVFASLANRANGTGPDEPDFAPWHALQSWLELAGDRAVTIPFAHTLASLSSARAVRLRRDFAQLLSLICAHALLYQAQRGRDAKGRIVATIDDYRAVYDLVIDILSENVAATVSQAVRETVVAVDELLKETTKESTTVLQVAERLKLDKSAASRRVRVAIDLGYLVNNEERRGRPSQLILGEPLPEDEPILPSGDDLIKHTSVYPLGNRATVQPVGIAETVEGGPVPLEEGEL